MNTWYPLLKEGHLVITFVTQFTGLRRIFFKFFTAYNICLINQKQINLSPSTNMSEINKLASLGTQRLPYTQSSKIPTVLGLQRWAVT